MIRIKRIVAIFISVIMVLSCVACNDTASGQATENGSGDITEAPTSAPTEAPTEKETDPVPEVTYKIYSKDLKEYKFVVGEDASNSIIRAAEGVSVMAKEKWGSDGTVEKDSYSSAESATFEVLVGDTDRPESREYIDSLEEGEGGYAVIGSKIVVAGYSDNETITAMNLFYNNIMLVVSSAKNVYMSNSRNLKEYLADHVSVMSFNVFVGIGGNAAKRENALKIIRAYNPDIFGVQEASYDWQNALKSEFNEEYEIIGKPRENTGYQEAVQIFVRKSKFDVLYSDTKWLTDTPDQISKTPGAQCYRNVTYATLITKDNKVFNYANTHLDHVANESVRVAQIGYLDQILNKDLDLTYPTLITGDFNMVPTDDGYKMMTELGYAPSYELATLNHSSRDTATFKTGGVIDYCFVSDEPGVETYIYKVCNENIYGENSDHNAVYTMFRLK